MELLGSWCKVEIIWDNASKNLATNHEHTEYWGGGTVVKGLQKTWTTLANYLSEKPSPIWNSKFQDWNNSDEKFNYQNQDLCVHFYARMLSTCSKPPIYSEFGLKLWLIKNKKPLKFGSTLFEGHTKSLADMKYIWARFDQPTSFCLGS